MTTGATITRLKLPAVRHFVESQSWAIEQGRGMALLETLALHAQGGAFSPEHLASVRAEREARDARRGDGRQITKSGGMIAVLPLYGPIAQRMDLMMDLCGGTSAERFADEFDAAMADPNVSSIVIDCDSPGGSVSGTPELAARIFAARGKGKKLIAVSNSCMASAAYWICSACDEIVASPSADTGSIGVFTVHVDESGMNEMLGLKYTLIKAGAHKAEGNPWEPLPADAESFIQGQIDEMMGMFVGAVATHRGRKAADVAENFGQGRCFTAKQAKACGMIDRIDTLENVLKKLGAKDVGMSGRPVRALAVAGGVRADDSEPTDTDDDLDEDDIEICPECAAPMDGDSCSACDYTRPMASAADDDSNDESDDSEGPEARGRARDGEFVHPAISPAPQARSSTMSDKDTAAERAAIQQAAVQAEQKRSKEIRQLCADHDIEATVMNGYLDNGMTMEAVTADILGRKRADRAGAPNIRVGADREAEKGFANVGEQLQAVIQAGKSGRVDRRLLHVNAQALKFAGSPSGMNESVGSEGGFFIQNDLLPGVIEPVYQDDPLLSRVNRIPVGEGKNGVKFNVVDETSRADGSRFGGIQMFYADEADSGTAKKPKLRRVELELRKIIGLAYLTDELMQDAPAAQTLLVDAFQTELRFMIATGIWRGLGGNQPLGFLKGSAFTSQAIESGQTIANSAASISQNVAKMLTHIPAGLLSDVIWLYNPELLPTLMNATVGSTSIPVFIPYAGLAETGTVDRILGRPAFASEQAEAVGTAGDIVAVCPSQYALADKGGPNVATSIHFKFDSDQDTLRLTYRFDGQPIWAQTVTPYKGSAARSPFVGLAARS